MDERSHVGVTEDALIKSDCNEKDCSKYDSSDMTALADFANLCDILHRCQLTNLPNLTILSTNTDLIALTKSKNDRGVDKKLAIVTRPNGNELPSITALTNKDKVASSERSYSPRRRVDLTKSVAPRNSIMSNAYSNPENLSVSTTLATEIKLTQSKPVTAGSIHLINSNNCTIKISPKRKPVESTAACHQRVTTFFWDRTSQIPTFYLERNGGVDFQLSTEPSAVPTQQYAVCGSPVLDNHSELIAYAIANDNNDLIIVPPIEQAKPLPCVRPKRDATSDHNRQPQPVNMPNVGGIAEPIDGKRMSAVVHTSCHVVNWKTFKGEVQRFRLAADPAVGPNGREEPMGDRLFSYTEVDVKPVPENDAFVVETVDGNFSSERGRQFPYVTIASKPGSEKCTIVNFPRSFPDLVTTKRIPPDGSNDEVASKSDFVLGGKLSTNAIIRVTAKKVTKSNNEVGIVTTPVDYSVKELKMIYQHSIDDERKDKNAAYSFGHVAETAWEQVANSIRDVRAMSREEGRWETRSKSDRPDRNECPICRKSFATDTTLSVHTRLHAGDHPYMCVVCAKTCANRSSLRRHLWTHSSAPPSSCEYCEKMFVHESLLRLHQRIHFRDQLKTKPHGQTETESRGQIETESRDQTDTESRGQTDTESSGQTETELPGQIKTEAHNQTETKLGDQTEAKLPFQLETKSRKPVETMLLGQTKNKCCRQTDLVTQSSEDEVVRTNRNQAVQTSRDQVVQTSGDQLP